MAKKIKTRNYRAKSHRKSRRFSLIVAGEMQKLKKLVKYVIGTPRTTNGRPTSIETTQKHVVFTTRDNEKRRLFWPQMVPNEAI